MSCFCDPETTQPVRISVRDHVTIAVVYNATGRPAPTGRYRNIDELFVWLDEYISDDQNVVDVQYHPVYHFPIDITGNTENALDSGITYRLSEFSQQ